MAKHIFVVDDEKSLADTLVAILRNFGYEATPFYDAQAVINQTVDGCPDLIISDVMMPGMNGVDMAVLIRERHPKCKILLFSGHAAASSLFNEAVGRGHSFELISKPIHPVDLLARVAAASEADIS